MALPVKMLLEGACWLDRDWDPNIDNRLEPLTQKLVVFSFIDFGQIGARV